MHARPTSTRSFITVLIETSAILDAARSELPSTGRFRIWAPPESERRFISLPTGSFIVDNILGYGLQPANLKFTIFLLRVTMPRKSRQNPEVRDFILRGVEEHPAEIGPMTAKRFGLSRTAVARYVNRLVDEGFLTAEGKTNARTYKLKPTQGSDFHIEISPGLAEDHIFRFRILPLMSGMRQNIIDICQYGFTEMLNNVIDHSGSPDAIISYKQTYTKVRLLIIDRGVGIFEKIQKDFNLADPTSALLELSKGKLTSDAAR